MHFSEVTTTGSVSTTLVGDLSAAAAQETLRSGGATLTVLLVGGVIYLQGTPGALQGALGPVAARAATPAGRWISVQSGDQPFDTLAHSLALSSELDLYVPVAPGLTAGKEVVLHGHRAVPVTGTAPSAAANGAQGSATLLVPPGYPRLPLGATLRLQKGSARVAKVVAFTHWGVPVHLTAPESSVPYSSLVASRG